jgi:hypothetical protein
MKLLTSCKRPRFTPHSTSLQLQASIYGAEAKEVHLLHVSHCVLADLVEWLDQNPLGQIGVVGTRAGIGEMSGKFLQYTLSSTIFMLLGNPQDVPECLCDRTRLEPTGEPSPRNAIEMARSSVRYISSFAL